MKKRMKLMLAALLGFSTACSTVKNGQQADSTASAEGSEPRMEGQLKVDTTHMPQRIRLMYGVPSPRPNVQRVDSVSLQRANEAGRTITVQPLENPTEE